MTLKTMCENIGCYAECCNSPALDYYRPRRAKHVDIYCLKCGEDLLRLHDIGQMPRAQTTNNSPREVMA